MPVSVGACFLPFFRLFDSPSLWGSGRGEEPKLGKSPPPNSDPLYRRVSYGRHAPPVKSVRPNFRVVPRLTAADQILATAWAIKRYVRDRNRDVSGTTPRMTIKSRFSRGLRYGSFVTCRKLFIRGFESF